jgi:hypothetical protein
VALGGQADIPIQEFGNGKMLEIEVVNLHR